MVEVLSKQENLISNKNIKIGFHIPLFLASLVTLFIGTFTGLIGVWLYLAWKISVPEYVKTGHAHTSWWSILILIGAFFLPSISLKPIVKRFIVWSAFLAPLFWQICLAAYYVSKVSRGAIEPLSLSEIDFGIEYLTYGTGIFVMEVWLFLSLGLILLSGFGFKIPFLSQDTLTPSKYELMSNIEIPRSIFLFPLIFGALGLLIGWYMTIFFKVFNRPIDPAALVQFHSHLFFYVVGFFLTLMTLKAVGSSQSSVRVALWLGFLGIPAIFIGYLLFIHLQLPSFVYVLPSSLYFLLMILGLLSLLKFFGFKQREESFDYLRGCMIFSWSILLFLIALGPLIAIVWDTNPNLTVTYKQPPGMPYPGPYPSTYLGTEDVGMTPRGLENAHLSPGSWFHMALFWLLALLIFGNKIFKVLNKSNLIFFVATTIPLAPFFNVVGRFTAWLKIPNGIGALYFAGQPLKMFNILFLIVITCSLLRHLKRKHNENE